MTSDADSPTSGHSIRNAKFRYPRGTSEFDRFLSFTDGVIAIALTLLILGIDVPTPVPGKPDPSIASMLSDLWPQIFAFILSFVIIGLYWIQHHRFVAQLKAVDIPMIMWNFWFLLLIVFMPLLAQIMGFYSSDEGAVIIYAAWFVCFGIVDCIGFLLAKRRDLLADEPSPAMVRYQIKVRLGAPLVFLLSIPIAYMLGTDWATRSWLFIWPVSMVLSRNPPSDEAPNPASGGEPTA